jgi:hypothetical protein
MDSLYALKYRPVGLGTIPKNLTWEFVRAPTGGLRHRPDLASDSRYPHGVFKTERPLTPEEMYDFEIKVVTL